MYPVHCNGTTAALSSPSSRASPTPTPHPWRRRCRLQCRRRIRVVPQLAEQRGQAGVRLGIVRAQRYRAAAVGNGLWGRVGGWRAGWVAVAGWVHGRRPPPPPPFPPTHSPAHLCPLLQVLVRGGTVGQQHSRNGG